jgi:hypothetical protein
MVWGLEHQAKRETLVAHPKARRTVFGRQLLVARVEAGWPAAHVAEQLGINRATAYKWVRRHRAEGDVGLEDRSSRPKHSPRRLSAAIEAEILAARSSWRYGDPDRAGPDRQRLGVHPRRGLSGGPRTPRNSPQADPALAAPDQQQGRALHPDADQRVGVRPSVCVERGAIGRPARLRRFLQSSPAPHRSWRTLTPRRCQRRPWRSHLDRSAAPSPPLAQSSAQLRPNHALQRYTGPASRSNPA